MHLFTWLIININCYEYFHIQVSVETYAFIYLDEPRNGMAESCISYKFEF